MDPSALQCGVHWPYDEAAADALRRAGEAPTVLHNNCSGKHAGILALCKAIGADPATYLDAANPAQRRILEFCARLSDDDAATWPLGVDGCGIPVYATSLRKAALSFARFASLLGIATTRCEGPAYRARRDDRAFRSTLPGPGQFDTELMIAGAGAIACKGRRGRRPRRGGHPARLRLRRKGSRRHRSRARGPSTIAVLRRLARPRRRPSRGTRALRRVPRCIIGPGIRWERFALSF